MSFPVEIWREVFIHLDRYNVRTCKSVSRLLKFVVCTFYSEDIHIKLNSTKDVLNFLSDLQTSLFLKQKTSSLTMKGDVMVDPDALKTMLGLCSSNLTVVTFDVSGGDSLLKSFNSLALSLPKIQEINITTTEPCSVALTKLHLLANLKFCNTITAIHIMNVSQNLILQEYGGLAIFLSLFPKLCRLKACNIHRAFIENIYLDNLLYHNKNLQYIELENLFVDTHSSNYIPQCPYLSKVHLSGAKINISALKCITSACRMINSLHLSFQNIINNSSMPEEQVNGILEKLLTFDMDNINIRCVYKNRLYSNNKESMNL